MIEWHKYVKRYCWDVDKTPYFVPVSQLKRDQANKELFLYSFILGAPTLLYVTAFISNVVQNSEVGSLPVTLYMASLVSCAIVIQFWKSPGAALYSLTAPIVMALYLLIEGFPKRLDRIDFSNPDGVLTCLQGHPGLARHPDSVTGIDISRFDNLPDCRPDSEFYILLFFTVLVLGVWAFYSRRLLALTKAYPTLPTRDMNPWNKIPPGNMPPRK